jgi:biotin carboxyl carrier protein
VTSGAARKRRKTVTAKDDQAKESARGATPAVARSQEQASKTITAQQSSAAESNGKPVQSPLAGELQNYVNDRYREHPAHKVPCSSTYVQAMSGAFGRDPTRTEIKKGLQ